MKRHVIVRSALALSMVALLPLSTGGAQGKPQRENPNAEAVGQPQATTKPTAAWSEPKSTNGGTLSLGAGLIPFDGSASTSSPRGHILRYRWTFGDDGTSSDSMRVYHRFTRPGHHVVTLVVTDGGLASDPYKVTVVIPPAPPTAVIDPPGNPVIAFVGKPVPFSGAKSFSNPAGHALIYSWTFADGDGGMGVSMPHTFKREGKYLVTLSVMDEGVTSAKVSTVVEVRTENMKIDSAAPLKKRP